MVFDEFYLRGTNHAEHQPAGGDNKSPVSERHEEIVPVPVHERCYIWQNYE